MQLLGKNGAGAAVADPGMMAVARGIYTNEGVKGERLLPVDSVDAF
jgi:hypothetical protein